MVAKYRPKQEILALCMDSSVLRNLNLSRGVNGLKIPSFIGNDNLINDAIKYACESGKCSVGDNVVCIMGQNEETPEMVNILKVTTIN
jgi:pyruvate kinase